MRSDYWDVTDEQVVEKTGQSLAHWSAVIAPLAGRKSNDIAAHLRDEHGLPRYWARTLTTWHQKRAPDAA